MVKDVVMAILLKRKFNGGDIMNGFEKIKEQYLKSAVKDKVLIKIVTFLMKQPNMSDLYLNEEKNLEGMMDYVRSQAHKVAINNEAVVDDDEVYQWVNEYFSKSNEELGINKKETSTKTKNTERKEVTKGSNQLKLEL